MNNQNLLIGQLVKHIETNSIWKIKEVQKKQIVTLCIEPGKTDSDKNALNKILLSNGNLPSRYKLTSLN
ncbi:MAG: hypothetical protein IPO06_29630 [Leptospiraceae bacterium]|nr:hypothetical protein [Leptospiraceae bacterium]MBP6738368.1 hypothetical protein [Leptospiraceae bacterium]